MSSVGYAQISLVTYGDVGLQEIANIPGNTLSMGAVDYVSLAPGNNVITPPAAPGYVVIGLLIKPPVNNTYGLVIKGNPTDIGIQLHPSNPTFLSLNPTILNVFSVNSAAPTPVTLTLMWI